LIGIEQVIFRNMILDDGYMRKVLPFVKDEYFEGLYRKLYTTFKKYVEEYNRSPTKEAFILESNMTEQNFSVMQDAFDKLYKEEKVDTEWLLDQTEKWCQGRALEIAIVESVNVIEGKHDTLTKGALPDLLQKALGVAFDVNVGHDYIDNVEERWDFYDKKEERLPFDLEMLNTITKGGVPNKTLNIALAGTGVGKSLFMCHVASSALTDGKNVLYITMEMAEERIAERIDANLLNVPIDQLEGMPKTLFTEKVRALSSKTSGKLIIKEYPTGSAHAGHFRALLGELKLKRQFVPDIIFIDYLNICASSRMKGMGGAINSYTYIKAIAEELRGLAVEFDVPIFSATQTTRSGYSNSDVGLEDTSESFGLPATADLMFALISTEELNQRGQIMVKQLKNRYNDPTQNKRFVVGVDRSKMRLFDVDPNEQTLTDDTPVFDKSESKEKMSKFKDWNI
jgi:replicative DNA helicase